MSTTVDHKLEDVYEILTPLFEKQGFHFYAPKHQFVKDTDTGYITVILYPQVSGTKYLVDIHLGARIDRVEEMIYPFLRHLPGYYNHSITTSMPYGKLTNTNHPRIFASNNTELMKGLEDFHHFMENEGFILLHEMAMTSFLEEKFNKTPHLPSDFQFNNVLRAFRGIALAKQEEKPLEELIEVYRTSAIQVYGNELVAKQFEAFCEELVKG